MLHIRRSARLFLSAGLIIERVILQNFVQQTSVQRSSVLWNSRFENLSQKRFVKKHTPRKGKGEGRRKRCSNWKNCSGAFTAFYPIFLLLHLFEACPLALLNICLVLSFLGFFSLNFLSQLFDYLTNDLHVSRVSHSSLSFFPTLSVSLAFFLRVSLINYFFFSISFSLVLVEW